jgi:hypothetical protein
MKTIAINLGGINVNALSKGKNFNVAISREEAINLLSIYERLPFEIMCMEAGDDEDWIGITEGDIEYINGKPTLSEDYQTFEIWMVDTIDQLPDHAESTRPTILSAALRLLSKIEGVLIEQLDEDYMQNPDIIEIMEEIKLATDNQNVTPVVSLISTNDLKHELKIRGYYTDNLWQIDDVRSAIESINEEREENLHIPEMSADEMQDVLNSVLNGDPIMTEINETINWELHERFPESDQEGEVPTL